MTQSSVDISDELYQRLQAHFDGPQLVELAATAALENYRARLNRVFRIEPNAFYCPVTAESHAPEASADR